MVRIVVVFVLSLFIGVQGGFTFAQSLKRIYVGDRDGAWLGVSVTDVTKKIVEEKHLSSREGALVSDVVENSPAEKAGIREGDVIVRFDDRDVEDSDGLVRAVRRSDAGDKVKIVIDRKGKSKTLTATLKKTRKGNSFAFRVPSVPRIAPVPREQFHMRFPGYERPAGLSMQDLGKQLGEFLEIPGKRGVLVTSVSRKSDGEKAGIKAGDVIVRVNGITVRDVEDCLDEIRDADDNKIGLDLIRRGKPVKVTVTIESSDRLSGDLFFDDWSGRLHDELLELKESLPSERETLRELKEHLHEMKEELRDGMRENIRESFLYDLRNIRDGLQEAIHEHLPLLRSVVRTAFLSI